MLHVNKRAEKQWVYGVNEKVVGQSGLPLKSCTDSKVLKEGTNMNKCKGFAKIWFLGLLLVAVVAGCARNGEEILIIPDTTAPTVSFTSPANGEVAVPYDRKVAVAFSEAMAPLTINATSFTLTGPGGTAVPGTVAPVGPSATFTPTNPLAFSTVYTATITTGVKDLAGNAMASNYSWSFTTGAVADTIAPTVSFSAPVNGQTAVPINRILHVAFSEAMDPSTINAASFTLTRPGLIPVAGTVTSVGPSATFTPASALAYSTTYTATITTAVKDLAGNALVSNYVWNFTTGTAADSTRPTVSFTSPTNGAVAVPLNRKVNAAFSEAMNPLTLTTTTFTLTGPGLTPVLGTVTPLGTTAIFKPTSILASNTVYTGTITTGARDLAGNALASNYVWTFTTGLATDATAPLVISTIPLDLATGVVNNINVAGTFSEAMDSTSITTATYSLKATVSGINVPGTVTYDVASDTATFNPNSNLANSTNYTATIKGGISGVNDLAGNNLSLDKVWSFTTGVAADIVAPTVILVNPADLAVNVALNSTVNATFSEAMNPLTISTATFKLARPGGSSVTGTVGYNVASRIATFTPAVNLVANTTYTATVTIGSKDLAGNPLALDKVWSFTTGAGSALAPGAVPLGSAGAFGIMATSAITNTGADTMINGDVSLDPGSSNGLLPVQVNGDIHINDTVSAKARIDLLAAYNYATNLPPGTTILGGTDLGALYPLGIPPGTYTSGSTMLVSTPLVLDAGGNANAVWVFQIGSSLTTNASISLVNGAQAKNVFWVPQLDGTVGVGTIFYGTIISGRDVTGVTGAVINGRILAGATLAGTIALDNNTVNVPAP